MYLSVRSGSLVLESDTPVDQGNVLYSTYSDSACTVQTSSSIFDLTPGNPLALDFADGCSTVTYAVNGIKNVIEHPNPSVPETCDTISHTFTRYTCNFSYSPIEHTAQLLQVIGVLGLVIIALVILKLLVKTCNSCLTVTSCSILCCCRKCKDSLKEETESTNGMYSSGDRKFVAVELPANKVDPNPLYGSIVDEPMRKSYFFSRPVALPTIPVPNATKEDNE